MNRNSNLIYFNNNCTTPLDESVKKSMLLEQNSAPEFTKTATEKAIQQLCGLINARPPEILFTTGTTESVILALKGTYTHFKHKGNHIITNRTEHFAVLDCCKELEQMGADVTYLPVNREGLIDPEELRAAIKSTTQLVSIMAANNETGVIQPVEKISGICDEHQLFFFSDASQFAGKVPCDLKELGIGAIAFGAHKMYGPDGIGLLYIHEKHGAIMDTIRENYSGNLTLAQIIGFGKAAEISQQNYWENSAHISKLKNYFEHQLLDLEGLVINGSTKHRLYNTSNLTFPDHEKIAALLNRFDFADNLKKPSYVLRAMGLSPDEIKSSFRFSFGKDNTLDEVKLLINEIMK